MGAAHVTSRESDAILSRAHRTFADFLGAADPETICFGANMTTITLAVSRILAKQWSAGDEILVCRLDHDANFTPWILAAEDAGVRVRKIDLKPDDWTVDLDDFQSKLNERTRLVAVGFASNATGTINPVQQIVQATKSVGALSYIDAVHYAPHGRINVEQLGCDFLVCSAYKFFGPHVGILYGRRPLLEDIRPYKLRPSTDDLPGKWMTGTQNHEGIAGAAAAVEYLASLGFNGDDGQGSGDSTDASRSDRLDRAFRRISEYEQSLSREFLSGASGIRGLTIHGITDPDRLKERVPTFSMTSDEWNPADATVRLAEQGIFAWAGNHYALPFTEAAGLEPDGTLRIGALHYSTVEEVQRVTDALRRMVE